MKMEKLGEFTSGRDSQRKERTSNPLQTHKDYSAKAEVVYSPHRVNEEMQTHIHVQMDSVSGRKAILPVRARKPIKILRKLSKALLWHSCKQRDLSSSEIGFP